MDGKLIFMFMLMVNLLSISFTFSCVGAPSQCQTTQDSLLVQLFDIGDGVDITQPYGLKVNDSFQNTSSAMLTPQAAGAKVTEGFSLFLDAVRMVLGVLSFLTPFPFLDLLNGLGMPFAILAPLGVFVFVAWFFSVVEMLRGAKF